MGDLIVVNRRIEPDLSLLGVEGVEIYEEMNCCEDKIAIDVSEIILLKIVAWRSEYYLREARSSSKHQIIFDLRIALEFIRQANNRRIKPPSLMASGVLALGTTLKVGNSLAVPCVSKNGVWKIEPKRLDEAGCEKYRWSYIRKSTRLAL